MSLIAFYTLYDQDGDKPCCVGMRIDDKVTIYDLFRKSGKPIAPILKSVRNIRDFLSQVMYKHDVVTSDFKKTLKTFNISLDTRKINVYDLHLDRQLDSIRSTGNQAKDHAIVKTVLDKMYKSDRFPYHLLIGNSAVVYEDLERRGVLVNETLLKPQWSMNTFSGRSKTSGFNLQGHSDSDLVTSTGYTIKPVLLHFDWIAADIRVASILSKDQCLIDSFKKSDPYTMMMDIINANSNSNISRSECKLALLKAVNSMDTDSIVLNDIYKDLGKWIVECKSIIRQDDGVLRTILGRTFKVAKSKNALAVLNGVMQGSVVHAMQSVIRRVWEKLSQQVVAEIHDSIVLCCPPDNNIIRSTINIVTQCMLRPFDGLLEDNPIFPVKVSMGKKWKEWKLLETHREEGVESARS